MEKLFDGDDVHFTRVAKGSAAPEFIVKTDIAYKIEEKINSLNNVDNPTFSKLAKLLQEDNTSAYFTKNKKRIFEIKVANDNLQKCDIKEEYELYGYVIKVGGRDDTVPLSLRDLYDDTIIYNCNTSRNLAKDIAKYLFETPIKLSGIANWIKMGNSSTWELKNFNIKNFETIELTTLENDLTKLKILYEFEAEEDIKSLISDNIKDMEHELNFDNIKKEIINYLKEMDIDLNKIPEKKIEEMAEDVLEFSINNDDTPYNLIWAVDYFREDVDKLRENKKDEENKSYLPYIIEKNKDISLVKYLSKETLYSVEIQNKDIGMSIYMGTDFRRAKEVYDKEKLFMDIQKTSNNILITTNVEVYGERLNKAIIGTDYLLGRKSSLIEYLQNELSNADKDFYEYNDNEKEDFKQKTEKILNELKQEKISLEPMYLYVNPINRSYEIANSEQTINKLKELSSKINEYINESEESEEDEL